MSPAATPSRPGATPLSDETVASLRASLQDELERQRQQVAEHQSVVVELTGQPDIDCVRERAIAEEHRVRASEAVAYIEHALHRIDAGSYGTCESCGGPIAVERLEAIPHARRCVSCPARTRTR